MVSLRSLSLCVVPLDKIAFIVVNRVRMSSIGCEMFLCVCRWVVHEVCCGKRKGCVIPSMEQCVDGA